MSFVPLATRVENTLGKLLLQKLRRPRAQSTGQLSQVSSAQHTPDPTQKANIPPEPSGWDRVSLVSHLGTGRATTEGQVQGHQPRDNFASESVARFFTGNKYKQ